MGLRPPLFILKRHSRVTLWHDLLQRSIAVSAAVASVAAHCIEVHDLSPLSVVVLSINHIYIPQRKPRQIPSGKLLPKQVRTCHASRVKSFTLNRTPPRGGVRFTRVLPVPGTSVSSVVVGHSYPYPEPL